MALHQTDITNLLSILLHDRNNAQTAANIEAQLHQNFGFQISGNQVKTRSLISFAIENGHLIKSSTSNPAGYWIENNPTEIRKYIASLKRRANKINQRANNLESNLE